MATKGNDVDVNDEVTSATKGPSEEDKQQVELPQSQSTSRDAPDKVIYHYFMKQLFKMKDCTIYDKFLKND